MLGRLGHRLHRAGFIVGQHHRHQRGWPARRASRAGVQVHQAGARTRRRVLIASAANRPPASTEACSMAETSSRLTGEPDPRRSPGVSASALASVPPEVKTTFRAQRADRAGDRGPGVLDQSAGLAALGVDRGGIAAEIPRRSHRLPGLAAKRRGRIPVEIDAVRHRVLYYRSPAVVRAFRQRGAVMATGDRTGAAQLNRPIRCTPFPMFKNPCFLPLASC